MPFKWSMYEKHRRRNLIGSCALDFVANLFSASHSPDWAKMHFLPVFSPCSSLHVGMWLLNAHCYTHTSLGIQFFRCRHQQTHFFPTTTTTTMTQIKKIIMYKKLELANLANNKNQTTNNSREKKTSQPRIVHQPKTLRVFPHFPVPRGHVLRPFHHSCAGCSIEPWPSHRNSRLLWWYGALGIITAKANSPNVKCDAMKSHNLLKTSFLLNLFQIFAGNIMPATWMPQTTINYSTGITKVPPAQSLSPWSSGSTEVPVALRLAGCSLS